MIPLRAKTRTNSLPAFVYLLIVVNLAVFVHELQLPQDRLLEFVHRYGFIPARATQALRGEAPLLGGLVLPAFTSMFLHAGWMHVLANMWFLHIFGPNVEDRLGGLKFVAFYLVCGLAAAAGQYLLGGPASGTPMVGASGAVAGVLGAFIVCWPRARITTLVPILFLFTLVDLPAFVVLGLWFVMQLLGGVATLGTDAVRVAYGAHLGGFVAGALLVRLLPPRRPRRPQSHVVHIPRGRRTDPWRW